MSSNSFIPAKKTRIGQNDLWKVEEGYLRLSLVVYWDFVNLNQVFADYEGSPSRRFFVYCDLVESNRVGGQLHLLIREVHFPKNGQGCIIQWMPLRRFWVDTVKVQLADPKGTLAKLKKGQTVVTVMFSKVMVPKRSPSPPPSITHHRGGSLTRYHPQSTRPGGRRLHPSLDQDGHSPPRCGRGSRRWKKDNRG